MVLESAWGWKRIMKVWEVGLDGAVRRAVGDEGCGIIITPFSPGVGGGSLAPWHPRVQGGPTSPSLAWETSVTAQESPSPCQTCPATLSINPCCGFGALHPCFPIFCDGSVNNSRGVFTRAGCCLPCSGGPCAPGVTRVRSCCSQELAKNPIPAFSPNLETPLRSVMQRGLRRAWWSFTQPGTMAGEMFQSLLRAVGCVLLGIYWRGNPVIPAVPGETGIEREGSSE